MERTEQLTHASAPAHDRSGAYIDWAAIFAGAVVATAVAALFTGFGAALGLSSLSAEPGEGSFSFAVILTGLWMVVTLVASYGIGGYIAGRMRRRVEDASASEVAARDGVNGLVVWGVAMIAGFTVMASVVSGTVSTAGSVAGSVASAAGSAAGGMAQGALSAAGAMAQDAAASNPMGFVTDTLLRPAAVTPGLSDPAELARQSSAILANVVATGEISDPDRAYLISAATATSTLSAAEAQIRVDAAVETAQTARTEAARLAEEAKQAAIDAAEVARVGAVLAGFLIAAASLVAAAAAFVGGVRGGLHRDEGRIFSGLSYSR